MSIVAGNLLNRARQEYLEMPGLLLTTRQASRLWNLDAAVCEALLSTLVLEEFLSRTGSGAYLRRSSDSSRVRATEPDAPLPAPDGGGKTAPVEGPAPIVMAPERRSDCPERSAART
jgi:hypothetical protein